MEIRVEIELVMLSSLIEYKLACEQHMIAKLVSLSLKTQLSQFIDKPTQATSRHKHRFLFLLLPRIKFLQLLNNRQKAFFSFLGAFRGPFAGY